MEEDFLAPLLRAIREDPMIRRVTGIADRQEVDLYLVGGWIRDRLLGRSSCDYDWIVVGDAGPLVREISRRLSASFFTMGSRGRRTYRIVGKGVTLDFVSRNRNGLLPELLRRDFSINTLAFSFADQTVLDPSGGLRDVRNGMIRMVSSEVLGEDPIRMLRAVRFCTVLKGFALSAATLSEIRKQRMRLRSCAVERVREEVDRILLSGAAGRGVSLMRKTGLLPIVFPDLSPLAGLSQGPYHHKDALQHTFLVVRQVDDPKTLSGPFGSEIDLGDEDRIVLAYAALLHDIGKPESLSVDPDGTPHFYGHEKTGAEMAARIMEHYRFPNRRAERIHRLIRCHVLGLGLMRGEISRKALRRIIHRVGADLPLHVLLALADRRSARGRRYREMERRTIILGRALLELNASDGDLILKPPPLISGRDVMEILSIAPGPEVGRHLRKVRELQVDQEIRTREEALAFLRGLRDGEPV